MSLLTHEQMRDFIATHDFRSPEDVQRALKGLFAETLQAMLDSERKTVGLSQASGRPQATPNRRNGRYPNTSSARPRGAPREFHRGAARAGTAVKMVSGRSSAARMTRNAGR